MGYTVAVVGTGNPEDSDTFAIAYRHARAYERLDGVEMVACADIVRENAVAFADTFGIERIYEDYEQMLDIVGPDIVSVCTPPPTHAEIVTGCAAAGVRAVHCEKPMAGTWGGCRAMVDACETHGTQLTINHQRRFAAPYTETKRLLDGGRIGPLERIELGGPDLYDYGTHLFDMAGYLTDQQPVEWVLGQVDCRDPERKYGLYQETEGLLRWRYDSGVDGFASTGSEGLLDCQLRLIGEDGEIEIGHVDGPPVRLRTAESGWQSVDTGRDGVWRVQPHPVDRVLSRVPVGPDSLLADPPYIERAIAEVVSALEEGRSSTLAAENALQTTEIVFAGWESARRGGRVSLPLTVDGNPLEAIVEDGSVDRGGVRGNRPEAPVADE
ncbi:Gfo/Idh/MocA family oxidoreductase [Halovenus sp. WSH3]|uniref:Gfo/Idh/MocA family oxidoreductase n=1 Tax=Halovenus carboxidivorans TaxID=2692199 RepID=A0A6B0T9R7_9EURY|nr:Gfo/Idh/MocA family oxidoreductase [Halovenus carboxidivorans]MXR52986.1 Gfo/Idh/MocA family oxidoreductase [Halovenus carboxidivorans]